MIERGAQIELESVRWLILQAVKLGGHVGATDEMILPAVRSSWIGVSMDQIRNEIEYLEQRKLVTTERPPIRPWRVRLTRHGHDLVDYVSDVAPGIDRPPKYWPAT